MNNLLRVSLAVAGLAVAGKSLALDQSGVPVQPPAIPGAGLVSNDNPNGPLFVAVYDPNTGSSMVQYLGLGFDQTNPDDLTQDLNFGVLGATSGTNTWNTVFSSAIGAGQQTRLIYQVFSFDSRSSGDGSPEGWGIQTTLTDGTPLVADLGGNIGSAVNAMQGWITTVVNSVDQCNKQNPCSIVNNPNSPIFWGQGVYGQNYGGALTEPAGGNLGTALAFFQVTVDPLDFNTFTYPITQTAYEGVFLLSANGQLIYDVTDGPEPVPLPAAVWMLLSGLAGFGVVSRRRAAESTAVAA
jgi:hypothetical protein